jgi:uncharacterized protein (TIGR03437 family)
MGLAMVSMTATASAYYYFLHHSSRTGPSLAIPEKFELTALPNKTVSIFVSDLGPTAMSEGDSFAALVSQIQLAAKVWNDVGSSDLRVALGGLFSPGTLQATPHIEVLFDDLPGVLARGGVLSRRDPVSGPNGPFVPIATSVLILNRNLTQPSPRPSFGEAFFMTVVHELGHALGLQHTLTSSVMSTEPTRATTRAKPLANDDVAGISTLYPTTNFLAQSGSIAGQVTMGGQGVHLASVVALMPDRTAVSALTNPDGTYRIDGVPPGQHYVYVQALPPTQAMDLGPAEVALPLGPDGLPIPASEPFETLFYPGTRDLRQATPVEVAAGAVTGGLNFAVQRRDPAQLISVTTYSFPGSVAVKPAYLSTAGGTQSLIAISTGASLTVNGAPAAGLGISVLGGTAAVQQVQAYPQADEYLQVELSLTNPVPGPRHLVFSLNNEIYVLPSAFYVVNGPPPLVSGVLPGFDSRGVRAALVLGANLQPDTRILFDGILAARASDLVAGGMMVYPPAGPPGYQAAVTALNGDGQSSLFEQATPAIYSYPPGDGPAIFLAPAALPAGAEAMVEITGVNTGFADGQMRVGFGSGDVAVRRVWVMSPTRLRVQVSVSPQAVPASTMLSVISGLQGVWQPFAFQILPYNPRLPVIQPRLLNGATGQPGVSPGTIAVVQVANLVVPPGGAGLALFLNDTPLTITQAAPGQISFVVPGSIAPGPAVLRLQNGSEPAYPVLVNIEGLPPMIAGVTAGGGLVDPAHPARQGDFLTLLVSGLSTDPAAQVVPGSVRVNVGGIEHQAMFVAPPNGQFNMYQVLFALSPAVPGGMQILTVALDGRTSAPFALPVRGL